MVRHFGQELSIESPMARLKTLQKGDANCGSSPGIGDAICGESPPKW